MVAAGQGILVHGGAQPSLCQDPATSRSRLEHSMTEAPFVKRREKVYLNMDNYSTFALPRGNSSSAGGELASRGR